MLEPALVQELLQIVLKEAESDEATTEDHLEDNFKELYNSPARS